MRSPGTAVRTELKPFCEVGDERRANVRARDALGVADRARRARDRDRIAARQVFDPFGLIARQERHIRSTDA